MSKKSGGRPASRPPGRPAAGRPAVGRPKAAPSRWTSPGFVAAAILAVATLVLFRQVMIGGLTFTSPDSTAPLGFARIGESALFEHGVYPLWNPYVFCGMPSFASLAFNPLIYPPDWPLALFTKVIPLLPGLTWLVLYYFLGGWGVYLLCREWGTGSAGALLAGLAFLSLPNLVAVGAHGHGSQLVDSAYLPWMLWLATRLFRRGRPQDVAWLALATGFQLLRGHVQVCYYTWLALGLYSLFELLRKGEDAPAFRLRLTRVVGAGIALGLGFALAAFLYMPVQEYARYSIRGGGVGGGVGLSYATQWSFSPVEMLTFLVPGAVGFGGDTYWGSMPFTDYPNYMGLGVLALALVGLVRARRPWTVAFLAALAGLSILVSFGEHGFLYPFLYDHLPQFNKFRVPVMILLLTQLATVCLAAMGFDAVWELREGGAGAASRRTRIALWVVTALAGFVLLCGIAPDLWRESLAATAHRLRPDFPAPNLEAAFAGATSDALRVGFLALVALAAAWLALRGAFSRGVFAVIVGLAAVIDLWAVDERLMAPVLGPPSVALRDTERDDVVDFLAAASDSAAARGAAFRILPIADFQSNRYAGFALASLGGYHAAKPKLSQEYIEADAQLKPFRSLVAGGGWSGSGFLDAANVEYVVLPGQLPPGSPLALVHQGSQAIYQNAGALPRVSLATSFEVQPADRQLARLLSAGYDARKQVLLEQAPTGALGPAGGEVRITRYGLNSVEMEASSPGASILRFADLYFPGWLARVDGRPTPVLRADFCFRALVLPPGRHRVEWTYESRALRWGLWVTGAALLAVAALFVLGVRRSRPR